MFFIKDGVMMKYLVVAMMLVGLVIAACEIKEDSPAVSGRRQQVEKTLQALSISFEQNRKYSREEIFELLEKCLTKNTDIFGAAWASPPDSEKKVSVYYIFRDGGTFVTRTEENVAVMGGTLEWYSLPLKTGKLEWCKPYKVESADGKELTLITCSMPIKNGASNLEAIIACDYLINRK